MPYFKNHWANYRLVCTHFDAFLTLNTNMSIKVNENDCDFFFIGLYNVSFRQNLEKNGAVVCNQKTREKSYC